MTATPDAQERADQIVEEVRRFWNEDPCGAQFVATETRDGAFFAEATATRYALEPHIPDVARFERWAGRDVLEIGSGLGTDGERFAAAGARYQAFDLSDESLALVRRRFALAGLPGEFTSGDARALPFPDASFDLVYTHGVIHHIPEMRRVIAEIHRVLRPGGQALVMVYNRNSLNYQVSIRVLRRIGALLLMLPGGLALAHRLTGESVEVLEGHQRLIAEHGHRYVTDLALFLHHNTDGPGNPYATVYGEREVRELFAGFARVQTIVRFLNLRSYPSAVRRLLPESVQRRLGARIGWHRYVLAER